MAEPRNATEEMQSRYRNVFGTAEGRIVLGDILKLGGVFDSVDPTDPAMGAERNFALTIGRTARAFDSLYIELGMVEKEN